MTRIRRLALVLAALALATPVLAQATPQPADCYDPVGTTAFVVGLNPNGLYNLSVRPIPGGGPEIDELFMGDRVCAIGEAGGWAHVQYIRDGRGWTGWVASQYLFYPQS